MDTKTLKSMEAAVWGDTQTGGAGRIVVTPIAGTTPLKFDKQTLAKQNALPQPQNNKTTQGLWYHSFGMDDTKTEAGEKRRHQRWFVAPGAKWALRLVARKAPFPPAAEPGRSRRAEAEMVLNQARAALWLFCHYGSAGSKSRKGFGCFAEPAKLNNLDLAACKATAAEFRKWCGVGGAFSEKLADSPSLEQLLDWVDVPLGWSNSWWALDQVAAAAQRFAQDHKHRNEKKALGLPRKIGHPAKGQFRPGRFVKDRHASPVFYHFAKDAQGNLVLRVAAFPAKQLPDLPTSKTFLQGLLKHLAEEVPDRVQHFGQQGRKPVVNPGPSTPPPPGTPLRPPAPKLAANQTGEAELLAEKTGKGGWKAKHLGTGLTGPIVNSTEVPADKKPGDKVQLVVTMVSTDGKSIQFRYPTGGKK